MQNVTTIQLLPHIGFFRSVFCIGRRVSVLFLKQHVDLFFVLPTYVKLHLEPRYNSCTLRYKHQRSIINKHGAHTIMLTTKNTPIICTYRSARLHLKAKFEKSMLFLSSTISHARWFPFMPSLIHGYPLFFLLLHISVLICVAWHLMLSLLLTSV